ncbi:MAG: hypothetical protein ACMXYA_03415 [Candidatus Woesearchaeota archaeon]
MKSVRILLKGDAKKSYEKLKKRKDPLAEDILRSFDIKKEKLRQNPQLGNAIAKQKIPKELKKLGITNLYRIELTHAWRMLYSIEGNAIEIYIFILTIADHKGYDGKMKY